MCDLAGPNGLQESRAVKTDQTVSVSGPQEGRASSDAIWILMPGFVRLENKN